MDGGLGVGEEGEALLVVGDMEAVRVHDPEPVQFQGRVHGGRGKGDRVPARGDGQISVIVRAAPGGAGPQMNGTQATGLLEEGDVDLGGLTRAEGGRGGEVEGVQGRRKAEGGPALGAAQGTPAGQAERTGQVLELPGRAAVSARGPPVRSAVVGTDGGELPGERAAAGTAEDLKDGAPPPKALLLDALFPLLVLQAGG